MFDESFNNSLNKEGVVFHAARTPMGPNLNLQVFMHPFFKLQTNGVPGTTLMASAKPQMRLE